MEKTAQSELHGLDSKLEEMLRNREDRQRLLRLSSNGSYSTSQYPLPLNAHPPALVNSSKALPPHLVAVKQAVKSSEGDKKDPVSPSSKPPALGAANSEMLHIPPPAVPLPKRQDKPKQSEEDMQYDHGHPGKDSVEGLQRENHKHSGGGGGHGSGHGRQGGHGEQGGDKAWWTAIGEHERANGKKHGGGSGRMGGQKGLGHPEGINGDYGHIDGDDTEGRAPRRKWLDEFNEAGNCSRVRIRV
jgi:hypothetical protein